MKNKPKEPPLGERRPMPRRTFRLPWSKYRFKWAIFPTKKPGYDIDWDRNIVTIRCDGNPLTIAKLAGYAGERMEWRAATHPEEVRQSEDLKFRPLQNTHPASGAFRVYARRSQMLCPHCGRMYLTKGWFSKHLIEVHDDKATAKSIDFGIRFDLARIQVKTTGITAMPKGGFCHAN